MTRMEDLLTQVETNPALRTVQDRAFALADLIPPSQLKVACVALAAQLLALRMEPVRDPEPRFETFPRPTPAVTQRTTLSGLPRPHSTPPRHRPVPVHASPKILAARRAWQDWLATEVTLPDTGVRLALQDMTADQLVTVADALYDAHEQVHRLAEQLTATGAVTARDLPAEVAQLVLETA